MKKRKRWSIVYPVIFGLGLLIPGCSSVPKEVVELSYLMGEDISAIHTSYNALIHEHFEGFKNERIRYLNEEWTPKYIATWIEDGRLRDVVKGDVVWSEEKGDFIKPVSGKEEQGLLATVRFWSQAAVNEIEGKKEELLKPLNDQENTLAASINEAFDRLYRANATITAHLNSLRNVQEVQDNLLSAMHIKDLRDKIDSALINASGKAKEGLDAIKKADGFVTEAKQKLNKTAKAIK
jgi:hypothetical protein